MKDFFSKNKRILTALGLVLVVLLVVFLYLPFQVPERNVHPSQSYAESVARFNAIVSAEKADPNFDQGCLAQLLTDGKPTDRVTVMFVGFTNCPTQMSQLGAEIQKTGENVLILNAPHHGEKDKVHNSLGDITTKDIIDYADTSIDIAAGLGKEVTVTGLSVGGVVSSWASQNRVEVTRGVNIAPIYTPFLVPGFIQRPAARIMNALPFIYIWWSPKNKENNVGGSPYAYTGFPLDALGKFTEVANMFDVNIHGKNPKNLKSILVVNDNDKAINKPLAVRETFRMADSNEQNVQIYNFAKAKGLDHDIIDPYNQKQQTSYTYPILVNLITGN
jgi:hypothetical protein